MIIEPRHNAKSIQMLYIPHQHEELSLHPQRSQNPLQEDKQKVISFHN